MSNIFGRYTVFAALIALLLWVENAPAMMRRNDFKPGEQAWITSNHVCTPPLPHKSPVSIVGEDPAFRHNIVVRTPDGREFSVFCAMIDPGFEYRINGEWLRETHPSVRAYLREILEKLKAADPAPGTERLMEESIANIEWRIERAAP